MILNLDKGSKLYRRTNSMNYPTVRECDLVDTTSGDSVCFPLPSLQLNWEYSYRFGSNMTLGSEFTVLSPAVRLDCMISDRHHIVVGAHLALMGRVALSFAITQAQRNIINSASDGFKQEFSGVCASLAYEYFTQSKNFLKCICVQTIVV